MMGGALTPPSTMQSKLLLRSQLLEPTRPYSACATTGFHNLTSAKVLSFKILLKHDATQLISKKGHLM